MTGKVVSFLCVAVLAGSALGQATPTSGPTSAPSVAGSEGTVGTVNGSAVYVRGAPLANSTTSVTKLSNPAKVTVVGRQGDWLVILPPPGTFSVIKKQYVQADQGGKAGTLTGDSVYVRPAGDLSINNNFPTVHGPKLNKGDKVTITGEMGDWYKIVPPTGANFYISAQYVDVAGEPVARRMPTTASSGMETTRIVKTATTGPAFNPEVYGKELSSFKELEKKLVEDAKKGAFDTKYFIEKYKALEVTDAGLKRWVKYRLDWLKDVEDSKKRVDESVSIYEETKKSTTELDRQIAGISVTKPPQVGPTSYDAEGVLYESEAFPGGATGPKRYVVRDPAFKRVDGYVVCTTGKVNLKDFLGKRIGIKGAAKFDSDLKLSVIDADEVVLLNDKANVPDSVKPKVVVPGDETTAPTPAPKPMPEIKPTPAPKTTEPAGTEVTTE